MLTLLAVISSVVALLIGLLAVPIDIDVEFNNQLEKKAHARISWLFGLVEVEVKEKRGGLAFNPTSPKRDKVRNNETKRVKTKTWVTSVLAVINSEGFLKRMFGLLRDVLTGAEIQQLQARLGVGLDDPADTGRLYGVMSPMVAFMLATPRVNVTVDPLFDRVAWETQIKAVLRIVPIRLTRAILRFIFSVESFRAFRAVTKANRT